MRRHAVLLFMAFQDSTTDAWQVPQLHVLPRSLQVRARINLQQPAEPFIPAAATGEDTPKTDGIPDYMLRNSGTVKRIAEGADSSTPVHEENGVLYESGRMVHILTSDIIDMVQQQGGAAEKVDYLGENVLVEGMLFDDFGPEDIFELSPPDVPVDREALTLEIVEPRGVSSLELGQLGEDEKARRSVAGIISLNPGFSGWMARVVSPGQVRAGFKIAKRAVQEE